MRFSTRIAQSELGRRLTEAQGTNSGKGPGLEVHGSTISTASHGSAGEGPPQAHLPGPIEVAVEQDRSRVAFPQVSRGDSRPRLFSMNLPSEKKTLKPPRIEVSRTNMKNTSQARPYRQTARAEAAAAKGRCIVEVFLKRLGEQWYDEITLDRVADEAGVTVQTVVRRFGGKAGLLDATIQAMGREAKERRVNPPGDPDRLVRNLVEDYEKNGDTIIRLLAVEGQHAALHEHLAVPGAGTATG